MLGYLDALIAALGVRDRTEVERLLAHPLSRLLPEGVRQEASDLAADTHDALTAPLRAMQLRHQTAELLRDQGAVDVPVVDRPEPRSQDSRAVVRAAAAPTRRGGRQQQMELPLSA